MPKHCHDNSHPQVNKRLAFAIEYTGICFDSKQKRVCCLVFFFSVSVVIGMTDLVTGATGLYLIFCV